MAPAADLHTSLLNQLLQVKRTRTAHTCVHPCIAVDFPHSLRDRHSLLSDVWEWQEFLDAEGVDRNRASMIWTAQLHPDHQCFKESCLETIRYRPMEYYLTASECLLY